MVLGEKDVRLVYEKSTEFQSGVEIDATGDPKLIVGSIMEVLTDDFRASTQ